MKIPDNVFFLEPPEKPVPLGKIRRTPASAHAPGCHVVFRPDRPPGTLATIKSKTWFALVKKYIYNMLNTKIKNQQYYIAIK
jgi:hypothetical protein